MEEYYAGRTDLGRGSSRGRACPPHGPLLRQPSSKGGRVVCLRCGTAGSGWGDFEAASETPGEAPPDSGVAPPPATRA